MISEHLLNVLSVCCLVTRLIGLQKSCMSYNKETSSLDEIQQGAESNTGLQVEYVR